MPPKRPTRPPVSPLLKALRLWDRRARRGVLPTAALLAEWQASVDAAVREGSEEASELRLRIASIGALVLAPESAEAGASDAGRRQRVLTRHWQAVFDAPRRGTVGKLADRVAVQLSGLSDLGTLPDQRRLAGSTVLRAPTALHTTLTDEPDERSLRSQDFIFARHNVAGGWLDRLGLLARYDSQVGGYSRLDMPFVLDTELELDWIEGEPDPFEVPEVIGPARQMAERLTAKGARVQVTRGREVPVDSYQPGEARAAEELAIAGAFGPISLGSLSVLDQAVPVEQRPGLLHLILAPGAVEAAKSLPVVEVDSVTDAPSLPDREDAGREPRAMSPERPNATRETQEQPIGPGPAPRDLSSQSPSPRAGLRIGIESPPGLRPVFTAGAQPLLQVTVDWVSGEDPWRDPGVINRASASLQARVGATERVEIVRGRELPFERYTPGEARAAVDLVLPSPRRPVSLAGVALLEGAVVELQRPGLIQVLLAPGVTRAPGALTRQPEAAGRDYPDLVLAQEDTEALDANEKGPDVGVQRRVDWTADLTGQLARGAPPIADDDTVARSEKAISQRPAYGLTGASTLGDQILTAGPALPLTSQHEPLTLQPQAPAMRVIDRQTELRRVERTRGAAVFSERGSATIDVSALGEAGGATSPALDSAPLRTPSAALPPPLELPLVVEADQAEQTASEQEIGTSRRDRLDRQPTDEPARSAPAAAPTAADAPMVSESPSESAPPVACSYSHPDEQQALPEEPSSPAPLAVAPPETVATALSALTEAVPVDRETEPPLVVSPAPAIPDVPHLVAETPPVTDALVPATPSPAQPGTPVDVTTSPEELSDDAETRLAGPQIAQIERAEGAEAQLLDSVQLERQVQPTAETARTDESRRAGVNPPTDADVTVTPLSLAPGTLDQAPTRAPASETIRITVDWVSGDDPWADPRRLEQAREALQDLEDQGVRVELVRGREVPPGQYNPEEAQRAADFQMLTAAGPVLLGGLALLDSAMLVAQRPGSLEVLLAPSATVTTQPGDQYRGAPDMPLAVPDEAGEGDVEEVIGRETSPPVQRAEVSSPAVPQPSPLAEPASAEAREPAESPALTLPATPTHLESESATSRPAAAEPPAARSAEPAAVVEPPVAPLTALAPGDAALEVPTPRPLPIAGAPEAERTVSVPTSHRDQGLSPFDLTVARLARRTQVVEITLDWIPGADPWSEPEQLEAARESARMLEDEGIRVVFRRGRELPAASYDVGHALQPIDFSVVGPSGPVLLESLSLLGGSNLISQRPGAIEVVLAPRAAPSRADLPLTMPDLVYSQELESSGETEEERPRQPVSSAGIPDTRRSAASRVPEAASPGVPQTVQVVIDWVAGENPWSGLAERTAELVQRLERQGIRLEFVAGRPVAPAEYAEAPAQAPEAFFLPTDRGAVSLSDASWLNQAVLRRQRPGLMHVLLAPTSIQPVQHADERALPELIFPTSEDAEPDGGAISTREVVRRGESSSATSPAVLPGSPISVPSSPPGIPLREPLAPTLLPAARAETISVLAPTVSPSAQPPTPLPSTITRDQERALVPSLEPLMSPGETSEEAPGGDWDQPNIEISTPWSDHSARRADRSGVVSRPLAMPGEFAAEIVQRTEDGAAPGSTPGATFPRVGDLGLGDAFGGSGSAGARPLWDNTAAMSVLVYDVTSLEGETDSRRQNDRGFSGWPPSPPIGSALTYIHEGRPVEPTPERGIERIGGYVIPSTLIYVSDGELMTAEPRQAARAAADRQPVTSGPMVQRAETEGSASATEGAAPQAPNLEALAREVYREIKWRLVVEHERAGTRRPTRGW